MPFRSFLEKRKEDDTVFNVQITMCVSNYAFSVFKKSTMIKYNEPIWRVKQWVHLKSKQTNAIYLPNFYSRINHNLNSTTLFNESSTGPKQRSWLAVSTPFSISSKVTAVTNDARWSASETDSVFLEQLLKVYRIFSWKMRNADNVLI